MFCNAQGDEAYTKYLLLGQAISPPNSIWDMVPLPSCCAQCVPRKSQKGNNRELVAVTLTNRTVINNVFMFSPLAWPYQCLGWLEGWLWESPLGSPEMNYIDNMTCT